MLRLSGTTEITREEFFEHGLHAATHYDTTAAGRAAQMANLLKAVRSHRQPWRVHDLGHPLSMFGDLAAVDLLVPEPQRRGRFRRACSAGTLKEHPAEE